MGKIKYVGCNIDCCGNPHKAKGFCNAHYQAYVKWGDPNYTSIILPWPNFYRIQKYKESYRKSSLRHYYTDKGREYIAKYRKTEAYKKTIKKSNSSDIVKQRKEKYRKSKKGIEARIRNVKKRRERIRNATPRWVDKKEINNIYLNCPKGYHVDHIIPLINEMVCGLHVPWNLQYMLPKHNRNKGNKI